MFTHIKKGDQVIRLLGGILPMPLLVTDVTETTIICGPYTFDRQGGFEIDDDLGWGKLINKSIVSGSILKQVEA